jgi:hypothetical protein
LLRADAIGKSKTKEILEAVYKHKPTLRYRTILVFKEKARSVFMYGYAKNERANITDKEEAVYKNYPHTT